MLVEVADLDRAGAFYSALLGVEGRNVGGGRRYYECGAVILGLVDVASGPRAPQPVPEAIYFAVADVEAFHQRALALGCLADGLVHDAPAGEVVRQPWGERSFYARDPFGNALCFVDATTLFTGR
jgi:catechol 2,3-dioxygenase-like lactoylglutathione lyase family enzyme